MLVSTRQSIGIYPPGMVLREADLTGLSVDTVLPLLHGETLHSTVSAEFPDSVFGAQLLQKLAPRKPNQLAGKTCC